MEQSRLIKDMRRLLPVAQGKCGLRQSEALFCHIKALPGLVEEACFGITDTQPIRAVAVSVRPRPVAGSYMPVFCGGELAARSIAAALAKPLYVFSHQEGHIAAACWSLDWQPQRSFIAAHLSGGTGELLLVKPLAAGYEITLLGSADLAPGQFVDRVGVALGLEFPAGPALEALAVSHPDIPELRLKVAVKKGDMSFSGSESAAQRGIQAGVDPAAIAKGVFVNIGLSLRKAVVWAMETYGCREAIIVGGVAANSLVKAQTAAVPEILFASSRFAGDNGVGIACLGVKMNNLER
ncbi:MAG: hypothetical protein RR387_03305 [Clostridiales bacterium]